MKKKINVDAVLRLKSSSKTKNKTLRKYSNIQYEIKSFSYAKQRHDLIHIFGSQYRSTLKRQQVMRQNRQSPGSHTQICLQHK